MDKEKFEKTLEELCDALEQEYPSTSAVLHLLTGCLQLSKKEEFVERLHEYLQPFASGLNDLVEKELIKRGDNET